MAEVPSVCLEFPLLPMPFEGVPPAAFGRVLARFEPSPMRLGAAVENQVRFGWVVLASPEG